MDNLPAIQDALVLAQAPINQYLILHLPKPNPTIVFAVWSQMRWALTEPEEVPAQVRHIKLTYRLVQELGPHGPYIYEYKDWAVCGG